MMVRNLIHTKMLSDPDVVLIIFAAVFTVALSLTSIAATDHGLGVHAWLIPTAVVFETMKSCILVGAFTFPSRPLTSPQIF
jgi:hypothetical protein